MDRFAAIILVCMLLCTTAVNSAVQNKEQELAPRLPAPASRAVEFAKDIQPILASRCVQCHSSKNIMGGLRLDSTKALAGGLSGKVILPGKSAESLLVKMIGGQIEGKRMPMTGDPLTDEQVGLIRRWIDDGAWWPEDSTTAPEPDRRHWAYVPPVRPPLPEVTNKPWVRNPIDLFVLARLEEEGLRPSPEIDRARLIRRLSLDLIGLPPSIEEVDAFIADKNQDAYEKLVERLLASRHYGERWARHWLDLARYADSHGYESDPLRSMWKYREWVIAAFNRNLPFDQFTIEQLAGDMLPNATLDQKIASGFHRNTMINMEGGVDAEETRIESVVDRTNTTATIWLGSTLACAQCHNHKYDPLSQKDYYRFLAFFNNTVDGQERNEEPEIEALTPAESAKRDEISAEIAKLEMVLNTQTLELDKAQRIWERQVEAPPVEWVVLQPNGALSAGGATLRVLPDGSILAEGPNPENDSYTIVAQTALKTIAGMRLDVVSDSNLPGKGPGRDADGTFVLSRIEVQVSPKGAPQTVQPVTWTRAAAEQAAAAFNVESLLESKGNPGWSIDKPKVGPLDQVSAFFETAAGAGFEQGTALTITLSNRSKKKSANLGRFRLLVTSSKNPVSLPDSVRAILALATDQRRADQTSQLAAYYRSIAPQLGEVRKRIADLRSSEPKAVKTMAMQERKDARTTHIHVRGSFLNKGEPVAAGVPALFPSLPEGQPADRLSLARWLVSEHNPLAARVTVNRIWEQFFGRGLVATSEDFGTQGEPPSHPELLDWLATELVAKQWDVKTMQRLIVTSATYRQSSSMTPELNQRDPNNRLLARGPRFRLEAEAIRDVALKASGLLSGKIGGPSAFPPQPEGIWTQHYSQEKWTPSQGEDRYRRGIYTFWRRTSPYPSFFTFDAPSRESCTARRPRTNTPLQALTTLNDPTFFEAAQHLALRIVKEGAPDPKARMVRGFRLCLARQPKPAELKQLLSYWTRQADRFKEGTNAKEALSLVGDLPWPGGIPVWEEAAWTVVANVLL
ncbi:MAG TPA: PSD1 and planctomycete cytochrome C domain-containing protein, partial [Terriglobia bacterium]|nr:PSD1 and planctomycete cytochrome C domain-containing protein [Terriglobia bacterium]